MAIGPVPSPMNINREVKFTSKYLHPPVYQIKNNGLRQEGTQNLLQYMRNKRHMPGQSVSTVLQNLPGDAPPPILHHIRNYQQAPDNRQDLVPYSENKQPRVVQMTACPVIYCYPTSGQQIFDKQVDLRQIPNNNQIVMPEERVIYEVVIPPNVMNRTVPVPVNYYRQG